MPTTEKLFFWNAENLFGSSLNRWTATPDKGFDEAYWRDGGVAFNSRVDAFATRIAALTGNPNGPEVLAFCETERDSVTAEAIRDRLNTALSTTYTLCRRELRGGRSIAPILLTRWTVNSTRIVSPDYRVIEVDLTRHATNFKIFVCHWPSKVSDKDGLRRQQVGQTIYSRIVAAGSGARCIVMGDLNDAPGDTSIATSLKAGSSTAAAIASTHPNLTLYDVMSTGGLAGQFTHYWSKQNLSQILDHFCCTGTLLTGSVQLDIPSVTIYTTGLAINGKPGGIRNGGYSDHFPIGIDITWS